MTDAATNGNGDDRDPEIELFVKVGKWGCGRPPRLARLKCPRSAARAGRNWDERSVPKEAARPAEGHPGVAAFGRLLPPSLRLQGHRT